VVLAARVRVVSAAAAPVVLAAAVVSAADRAKRSKYSFV
jgi:hypothetical protein